MAPEHFELAVSKLDQIGVSAVIIEDKTGLKNSLFGNDVVQNQATVEEFCEKISKGNKAKLGEDFMIIARIESLILEKGMADALSRAKAYLNAGADGIMIHSRKNLPTEVIEFAQAFRSEFPKVPLVCVPSSFNSITANELSKSGFNIVIYANQLMRASYKSMYNDGKKF